MRTCSSSPSLLSVRKSVQWWNVRRVKKKISALHLVLKCSHLSTLSICLFVCTIFMAFCYYSLCFMGCVFVFVFTFVWLLIMSFCPNVSMSLYGETLSIRNVEQLCFIRVFVSVLTGMRSVSRPRCWRPGLVYVSLHLIGPAAPQGADGVEEVSARREKHRNACSCKALENF